MNWLLKTAITLTTFCGTYFTFGIVWQMIEYMTAGEITPKTVDTIMAFLYATVITYLIWRYEIRDM